MKRTLFFIIAFVVNLTSLWSQDWVGLSSSTPKEPELNILNSNAQSICFEITIPGIYWTDTLVDGITFRRLTLPGGESGNPAGYPEIPVLTYRVAIPACASTEIAYRISLRKTLAPCLVYPTPQMVSEKNPQLFISCSFSPYICRTN
jgi:hypothetical protein